MDSNNRHKLFPGEIFPVPGEAFVIQRQRKMPHMSIRLVRRPRLRHQMFPFCRIITEESQDNEDFCFRYLLFKFSWLT